MIRAPLLLGLLAAALMAVAVVQVQSACTAAGQWQTVEAFYSTPFAGVADAEAQRYASERMPTTRVEGLRLTLAAIDMHLHAGHLTSALMLADTLQNTAPGSTISGIAAEIHNSLMHAIIEILLAGAAFVASYIMWRTEGIRKEASAT